MIAPAPRTRLPVAVIGAGVAGAATARALARREIPVLWFESAPTPAEHSSGRNAGLIRQAVSDPVIAQLCREGAEALRAEGAPVTWTSSILLDPEGSIPPDVRRAIDAKPLTPSAVTDPFPWLRDASLSGAFLTPGDGTVDAPALVERWRDDAIAAGAQLHLGTPVSAPQIEEGRVKAIVVDGHPIEVEHLVVATGAWGARWGKSAGVPIELQPTHRSLLIGPMPGEAKDPSKVLPWVWHLRDGWYVRPESAGGLWSAGEELTSTLLPAPRDRDAEARLRRVGRSQLPHLDWGKLAWRSTGHRTFLPDRRFLLGEDPRLPGWHWAVGLGGHGVTSALAVGERVAAGLVEGKPIEPELRFRPAVLPDGVTPPSVASPSRSSEAVR